MREITMIGCLVLAACSGGQANVDSAAIRDSIIVGGPPAIPSTQVATVDSVKTVSRPPAGTKQVPSPAKPATPAATPPTTDSVRGIVSVTGTSFEKHVMIAGGNRRVEITGSIASLIGHVAGAEVSVVGTISGTSLEASSFMVRSVDGQPAIDGKLKTEGGVLYIVTANGTRTRIVAPPPPLQGHDGDRVWITGDPAKGIASFGFIDPPR